MGKTWKKMGEITVSEVESKGALATQIGGNHYKNFTIQPAKFAEDNNLSFLEGCAIKRLCRHSRGGKGLEDLKKAIHEIQLIAALKYGEEI